MPTGRSEVLEGGAGEKTAHRCAFARRSTARADAAAPGTISLSCIKSNDRRSRIDQFIVP
jgi:hypothetical protein